jgi:LysR family transcriptional regulator, hypochlorite-specific transcription factor HypT
MVGFQMDTRWLDDLVALAEASTLTEAAQLRAITQPAFSRRVQQIESWLGIPVLDRSRRPARVAPAILRKIEELKALSSDLRHLRMDVREWEAAQRRIPVAAQHTISMGLLPRFIARLQETQPALSIRLRSANRDDCYTLLMTRQVKIMVAYEIDGFPIAPEEALIEKTELGDDKLCSVATPAIASVLISQRKKGPVLPIISFPADSFFGEVFMRRVFPQIQSQYQLRVACETALVPAALAMALEGAGVAWLPRSLCESNLRSGRLVQLDKLIMPIPMRIVCVRTTTPLNQDAKMVWDEFLSFMTQELPR